MNRLPAITLAALCAASVAAAQVRTATHSKTQGDSSDGTYVRLHTAAAHIPVLAGDRRVQVYADARMDIGVFGKRARGALAYCKVQQTYSTRLAAPSGYLRVRIGGNTVHSQSLRDRTFASAGHGPTRVVTEKKKIKIGFGYARITIGANAGLNHRLTAANRTRTRQVRLDGYLLPYATGAIRYLIVALGTGISRQHRLQFGSNRSTFALFASPSRVGGRLSWDLSAFRMFVRIFLRKNVALLRDSLFLLDKRGGRDVRSRTLR